MLSELGSLFSVDKRAVTTPRPRYSSECGVGSRDLRMPLPHRGETSRHEVSSRWPTGDSSAFRWQHDGDRALSVIAGINDGFQ